MNTPEFRPLPELSFEEARDELAAIVTKLEAGGAPLEHSLALWERGEALASLCQEWLDGARERIEAARTGTQETKDSKILDDAAAAEDA